MLRLVVVLVAVHLGIMRPVSGGVIISEIMYNPQGSDRNDTANPPFNREWVEIYNNGTSVVDLDGWQVGDSQDGDFASAFPRARS